MPHPQPITIPTNQLPIHLGLPAKVQMDDEDFFALLRGKADYRIERNAHRLIDIMPPTGGKRGVAART